MRSKKTYIQNNYSVIMTSEISSPINSTLLCDLYDCNSFQIISKIMYKIIQEFDTKSINISFNLSSLL